MFAAKTRRGKPSSRLVILVIAYVTLSATTGWIVWQESFVLPTRYFGTPSTPYSDALDPWLRGTLSYYFLGKPLWQLYRPTIGTFFASILSAVFDTRAIPILFFVAMIFFLARMFHKLPETVAAAVVLWLAMCAFAYLDFFSSSAPWTLTVDFIALFFTLAGVLLCLRAIDAGEPRQLILSCLPLGIAAAIRGPMLIGGIGLLVLAAALFRNQRHRWRYIGLATAMWLLPFCVDIAIQKQYAVTNNGLLSLFCFYADPRGLGMYTDECWALFSIRQPSASQVIGEYASYLVSAPGMRHWFSVFTACWLVASLPLVSFLMPLSILSFVVTVALRLTSCVDKAQAKRLAVVTGCLMTGAAILFLAGHYYSDAIPAAVTAAALAIGLPLGAWFCRSVWIGGLYIVFFASCAFLASVGMAFDRLIVTFAFALHLAFLLTLIESLGQPATPAGATNVSPDRLTIGTLLLLIAFLYTGNNLVDLPRKVELKRRFKNEVYQRQAAIKIASERRLDRSLYQLGDGNLVYTRYDQASIGSVIQYSYMIGADGRPAVFANDSLNRPARFVR